MCGIFGIWQLNEQLVEPSLVQQATSLLRHRGPDDEGYLFVNTKTKRAAHCRGHDTMAGLNLPHIQNAIDAPYNLAFGFRRLAILDLSANGHQPMASRDGRYWIIFNGEIYNYLELRAELVSHGHVFRTGTDTEVILSAYQQWGADCLSRFNGMWGLALWDSQGRELFCARDRLGVKPFYYFFDGKRLVFASEIKAILRIVPEAREVNRPYLAHFLMTGSLDHGEPTFFEGIYSLRPAHYFRLSAGATTLTPKRFWDVNVEAVKLIYDYSQPEHTFLNLLNDSVRLRLRSDVPVGTCLSGGLDSSAIVALSAKMLPHAMNSFSSIYSHPGYSEERFIRLVSQACGTRAHFTSPEPQQFFDIMRKIIWHMDEPAGGPGVYSQWFVMQLASQSVTVLLDGQGGDELFAGYFPYLPIHLLSLARKTIRERNPLFFNRLAREAFAILFQARRYFFPELNARQFVMKTFRRVSGLRNKPDLFLTPNMAAAYRKFSIEQDNPISQNEMLNRRLYWDITRDSIPALLHYEDRNSMAFSIEARVPLLDYRLVEFALGLPGEVKIKGATTKHFMRQALKNVLPEAVRSRTDKMGYPTPLSLWLRGPLRAQAEDFLQHHFERRKFYNIPTVQRLWREHQDGVADHSWQIFRWLTTELWLQNFIDGGQQ